MIDLRPLVYVIGQMLLVLALMMLVSAAVDLWAGAENGWAFVESAVLTGLVGLLLSVATSNGLALRLDVRQAYLLTVMIWAALPLFGALPFYIGAPGLGFTDAYFEAVSGITTTGSTVIIGLDALPAGMNLWRGMLNWIGGLGIAFVAMIFLPVMRVGGMQYFRTEGFDTMGKVLPRATDISRGLVTVYTLLTVACILTYGLIGMSALDAVVNGAATIATGGFSPSDASLGKYPGAGEYAGTLFMLLGSLPYIRYVQMLRGHSGPFWNDPQIWAFLRWNLIGIVIVTTWRLFTTDLGFEQALRETMFNLSSIMTGTGFFSGSYASMDGFILLASFIAGLIGGCSGSSSGALSVFRVQVAARALMTQARQVISPNRVLHVRYGGKVVEPDAISALMLYVSGYIVGIGVLSIAMTLTGVDVTSSIFGVWTSIGNIGYSFGPLTAPSGTFALFPDAAKWIMIVAMLMGRLGLLAMLLLILPRFWRG